MSTARSLAISFPSLSTSLARPHRADLVTDEQLAQAQTRLAIITPVLEWRPALPGCAPLRLEDGRPVINVTRAIEYYAWKSGVPVPTLNRWLARYKDGGRPALADRQRCDKNSSRFFAKYPRSAWMAAYLYLGEHASITVIHESIVRERELLEIPPGDLPCRQTIGNWLNSIPAALDVYARLGRKAYHDRMTPYLKRIYTDVCALGIVVGDCAILDVEGFNDCFEDGEYGEPVRIKLSGFLDFRSRFPYGMTWCWEGSSRSIAASILRGVQRYGLPDAVQLDNGKDYKKTAKGAVPLSQRNAAEAWKHEAQEIEDSGFFRRLDVAVTHSIPYHPQGKNIERFFRSLHERFDKLWPTYTSGTPFTRPDRTSVAMAEHRRLARHGRVDESKHPRVSRIIAECDAWMEEYADTPHRGEGMEGATPRQIFEAYPNPNQKPTPDPTALVLLLAERTRRLVRECAVNLDKRRYLPVDEAGWATMHLANDQEILVAYDRGAQEYAAALDTDGNFLAWLNVETLVKFAPGDPETGKIVAESMARGRRLEKSVRETVGNISRVARQMGIVSPLEAMQARHQLAPSVDVSPIITQCAPRLAPPTNKEPENRLIPGQAADRLAERLRRNQ